jgi:mediator of replication checkpoint protein 1
VDPHDVSWIDLDASDGEGSVRVKPIDLHLRKQVRPRRRETDNGDLDSSFDVSILRYIPVRRSDHEVQQAPKLVTLPEKNMARMQSWAKIEGRSRNAGTGRSVGGAAVTGHGRAKVKTGGGSLRNSSTASAASTDSSRAFEQRRPVKAMPSLLAGVAADRSTRFG